MTTYPMLDIFRVVCACLVALIHIGATEGSLAEMTITCFARQAVPFFFIVSGFFFSRKLAHSENQKSFVLAYARRMFLFYGVWITFQLPMLLSDYIPLYQEASPIYIAAVLIRRILLAGTAPFWYLLVLGETAFIAGMLLIRRKNKLLYWIGGVGLFLNYLYSLDISHGVFGLYQKLVYTVFSWNNNLIMAGIPYFAIGVFFDREQDRIAVSTRKSACAYLTVSMVSIACYWLNYQTHLDIGKYLFLCAPQAILLFMIGLNTKNLPIRSSLCNTCRALSSTIYCLHDFVIIYVMGEIIPWTDSYLFNFTLILFVCILIYYAVAFSKFKPLYRLITLK